VQDARSGLWQSKHTGWRNRTRSRLSGGEIGLVLGWAVGGIERGVTCSMAGVSGRDAPPVAENFVVTRRLHSRSSRRLSTNTTPR
jgi:hypothetical protein